MRARATTAPIGIAEEADKEVAEEEALPSIFMWWNAKGGEFPPPPPRQLWPRCRCQPQQGQGAGGGCLPNHRVGGGRKL